MKKKEIIKIAKKLSKAKEEDYTKFILLREIMLIKSSKKGAN